MKTGRGTITFSTETDVSVNNNTEFTVDDGSVVQLVCWLSDREPATPGSYSIAVIGDDEMARINEDYHGGSGATDVLSFDYGDGSGEILLNPYQHRRQAGEFDNSTSREFLENIVHAVLHLAGYDHTSDDGEHLRRQAELVELIDREMDDVTLIKSEPSNTDQTG